MGGRWEEALAAQPNMRFCVFFFACMRVKLHEDEGSKTISSRLRNRTRPVF